VSENRTTIHGEVTVEPDVPFADVRRGDIVLGGPLVQPRTVYRIVEEFGEHPTVSAFPNMPSSGRVEWSVLVVPYGSASSRPTASFSPGPNPWEAEDVQGLDRVVSGLS